MTQAADITGLVLAGGRGSRMGGVDKGLQMLSGRPLVSHVMARLQPQVGQLLINANRSLERYRAFGLPLISDAAVDNVEPFAGPLAGMLAGLLAPSRSAWLITVPCDCPRLPQDLVERLLQAAVAQRTVAAVPLSCDANGSLQIEATFCLLRRELAPALQGFLAAGGRKVQDWLATLALAQVPFTQAGETQAFANINTLAELRALQLPS